MDKRANREQLHAINYHRRYMQTYIDDESRKQNDRKKKEKKNKQYNYVQKERYI